jgi:type IV pilus assembly protein PilO
MTDFSRIVTEKRGIIVPLAVLIIANVLLYIVVVFPLGRQVASAQEEARAEQQLLRKARTDLQNAKASVTGKQQADAALQKFYNDVLPANASVARGLTFTRLSQLAQQANVRLSSGTNTVTHLKSSALSKLTTSYTLSGDYRDVRRFIYSLETTPEFIVLENVSLTSGSADPQERGLGMLLNIATYFRTGFVASE